MEATIIATPSIPMKVGEIKSLKVTDIKLKKSWVDQNKITWYYHNIFLQDKNGNTSRKEFCSGNEVLPPETFVIGVFQNIKCLKVDAKADLIEPVLDDEARKREERLSMAHEIANGKNVPRGTSEDAPVYNKECNRALSMAMSYAKDLKVAEITMRGMNSVVSDKDVEDVIRWGKKINEGFG